MENSQIKRVMKAFTGYAAQVLGGILGVASSLILGTTARLTGRHLNFAIFKR